MPSLLSLPPGAVDLGSNEYPEDYNFCGQNSQAISHVGSKVSRGLSRGGLPTPPTTTDMAAISVPTARLNYQLQHPYMTEQPPSTIARSTDRESSLYPACSTTGERINEYRAQQSQWTHATDGFQPLESSIASHLQIPESVNSSKGSLAEFAAEITCLFWFETSATIEYAEKLSRMAMPDRSLNVDAIPTIGFTKWVTTILSTTQVGKNVVLLALMFIYRLKKFNPSVSGKRGSEFRLLTIALMLGNKFLDDNTYTNKTWAEVSGISVNEVHIMEVEFLSNMRYELYASGAQWQEWQAKLGRFGAFYDKAARLSSAKNSPTTPVTQAIPHKLPSPPTGHRLSNSGYASLPNPMHTLPQLPRSPARQVSVKPYPFERKRSLDTSLDLPPAKRIHHSLSNATNPPPSVFTPQTVSTPGSVDTALSYDSARPPQLPPPNLPIPANRNGAILTPLALPGPRAMSAVYPSTTGYTQPTTPITAGLPHPSHLPGGGIGNTLSTSSHIGSNQTSPVNMFGTSTPTRPGLSPSYFLMNRSSPYRPVRHVNTLLYPPPSGAIQTPLKSIDYHQMHYQPLSKNNNQLHTGPMPCLQPDAWQGPISTPGIYAYPSY